MLPNKKHSQQEPDAPADGVRLAAYLDGELSPAEAARVEAWLELYPEACVSLEADRKLQRLWANARPAQPGPAAWDRVLSRVEMALGNRRRSWLWRTGGGLAAAAALFLLVWGAKQFFGGGNDKNDDETTAFEVLPVAGETDVVIVSMDAADVGCLVVGTPPVQGSLVLAGQDEVKVDSMQPTGDMQPYLHTKGSSPMIMVPIPSARRD